MTEFELIERLTEGAPRSGADLACGVGDDCAVVSGPAGRDWLITTDLLVEGIHFRRDWLDHAQLGRKAMAANLSDIAAMGGSPRFFTLSIAIPADVGPEGALAIAQGMRELASECGVLLIGGDTSSSARDLFISLTVVGEVASGKAIMRKGAASGDSIYVTGELGGSALGMLCLKAGLIKPGTSSFIERHRDPAPRLEEGMALAKSGALTSMIDVSDGLLADLGHICDASGVGFELSSEHIPVAKGFAEAATSLGEDPLKLALGGGEDYELLFTVAKDREERFRGHELRSLSCGAVRIGEISSDTNRRAVKDKAGNCLRIPGKGFDHFVP